MEEKKGKGLAIAGMVLGIVSLLVSVCGGGFIGIIGLILSIVALVKGQIKGMSIAGIVTSALAIIISILSLSFGGALINSVADAINEDSNYSSNSTSDFVSESNSSNSETSDSTTDDNIYGLNETFDYYGQQFTFSDFKPYDYPDYPQDGLVYYIVTLTVTNNSESPIYISQYDFNFYGDNQAGDLFNLPSDCDFSDADLSTGKTKTGHLIFEVPEGSEHITIEYMPNELFTNEVVVFNMQ